MTSIHEGEDDEDITSMDMQEASPLDIQPIQGPITRARARQLNLEVSSFLSVPINNFKNDLLPNVYNVIRNQGYMEEGLEAWRANKGRPSQAHYNSSSSPTRSPGAVFGKIDAQATNGVRFRRSTYGWKVNFIELPIQLV
jgi:hypothetical protein